MTVVLVMTATGVTMMRMKLVAKYGVESLLNSQEHDRGIPRWPEVILIA